MQKIFKATIIILTLSFLAGCQIQDGNKDRSTAIPGDIESKKAQSAMLEASSKDDCETQGGLWEVAGMSEEEKCFRKYSDGGKECNGSKDCQGDCVYEKEFGKAICQGSSYPYGCRIYFEEGKAGEELCVD